MPSALFVAAPAILFGSGAQANVAAAEVIDSTGKAVTKTVEVRGRSL